MKIAIVILAVLGAIAAGFLGVKWLGDLSALGNMSELQRMAVRSAAAAQGQSLDKMGAAAFLLILAFLAGLAGAFFTLKNRLPLAGGLLVGAGLVPVLIQPQAVVFTFLLIAAGGLAFFSHAKKKGSPS
ncbi:hypothetical protein [Amphiplicatus metriothermophilus]|uniref:DUF4064 domain-containing protein n=1 Tax=Amphiplicatus metriothermophilus TaxID=1519374 RepID=A0A239PL81_9PROT|nr:hypothetical protein [Amphiplicatus metriothermophilus]MBB5517349.1 hypothetical protein [Amphiplicatus metriothermophilus]SNT68315.1 hypothetical protein SAMN06297382_0817 [Amphiplicatus metriothermophilus]